MKGNVRKYEIADAMLVNADAVMGIAHHALRSSLLLEPGHFISSQLLYINLLKFCIADLWQEA